MNADMFAQIKAGKGAAKKGGGGGSGSDDNKAGKSAMLAQMLGGPRKPPPGVGGAGGSGGEAEVKPYKKPKDPVKVGDGPYSYDESLESFLFFEEGQKPTSFVPKLIPDKDGNEDTDILIPLAPCCYRMCDYTIAKKEPVELKRVILKLNVLRCLARERHTINNLLWSRFDELSMEQGRGNLEEDELGKIRFMELLSNCGVFQKVSELILHRVGKIVDQHRNEQMGGGDGKAESSNGGKGGNYYRIPQIHVDGLDDFLKDVEKLYPDLQQARKEIEETQSVSFYPGLGELFAPGSKLICYPEGMEGSPLGCSCIQGWYAEELNKATNTMKRRFVLVIEFIVSVGDELVFVAASDVYPEFHDISRNALIKDLTHRRLLPKQNADDANLLSRLQQRGEFYASVATLNHYLEYYPDSFFPIIGGWNSNAVRPLSKAGRVMVDVKRGILEGHIPVRGSSSDGLSDTVKEAIKLFESSKRTGVAVPFRTCILPGFDGSLKSSNGQSIGDSDRDSLWQSWPMVTGFSFTARVWGKLLLGMPKPKAVVATEPRSSTGLVRRPSLRRFGVEVAALGGEGSCGNCGYIKFQEQAFEQLVLAEDKKELIRAVARNAGGGGGKFDDDVTDDEGEDDDFEDVGIDVVANKGGASIFLLHGPPGCGKTLTAEAISELLQKPLYIVTAGDLGITAAEVEKTLGSVLDLCQTWDALVLIDEADVFLEARNSTEIQRNALVCVMLRLLEYYSGCLFLSSNRAAGSIDAAIASRITVMLGYPPLDKEGRAKVWKNLVGLVPVSPIDEATGEVPTRISKNPRKASRYRMDFTQADYDSLAAKYQLNGRQIKNSIVLARALARERGSPLSLPILQRAVTAVAGEGAAGSDGKATY